ncbi:hypothetical protein DKX38_022091 [Salix brachista]|uniref:Uncharacterized protein n=1 Tax=Salix brachista TaxID=2182728 RepID=A0A5N5JZB6_9ROSI|nr:hypothetical protein DKX38_022091 [Salix brachista]
MGRQIMMLKQQQGFSFAAILLEENIEWNFFVAFYSVMKLSFTAFGCFSKDHMSLRLFCYEQAFFGV